MFHKEISIPAGIRRSSRRQGLLRLSVISVILLIIGSYVSPIRTYIERSGQIEREQAITAELREKHQGLETEIEKLQRSEYIEQVARRDLGLIRPGEQPYVVKDLGNQPDQQMAVAYVVEDEPATGDNSRDSGDEAAAQTSP